MSHLDLRIQPEQGSLKIKQTRTCISTIVLLRVPMGGALYKSRGWIASFPGPAQLSVACSIEKQGEPGIFSHVSMT